MEVKFKNNDGDDSEGWSLNSDDLEPRYAITVSQPNPNLNVKEEAKDGIIMEEKESIVPK